MPWLADQIHGLGLKAGLYSSAGLYTCAGYPAVAGYETIDAADYAKWGFDYLKVSEFRGPLERSLYNRASSWTTVSISDSDTRLMQDWL